MTQRLFQNIPNFYYSNTLCKDITRRAKFIEDKDKPSFLLLPYELQHSLRADQVAEYYYRNSEVDWLIYMTNDIIDPYYEWYLNDAQFEQMLIHKYGTVENSMKKVKFYINNWADDQNEIDASYYDNNIPLSWKKYYVPSVWKQSRSTIQANNRKTESAVYTNVPLTYKRKEVDVIMNTNRILELTVFANNTTKSLTVGELIDFKEEGSTETVGTGEILKANSTVVRVFNVAGNTSSNTTSKKIIVGESSGANLTISNTAIAVKTLTVNGVVTTTRLENILLEEEVFWSPVTYFDYENAENEKKKFIQLPSAGARDIIVQKFFERLQENMDPISRLSSSVNETT